MNEAHKPGLGYLCYAWGESDHPVFRYVTTPAEVGQFFCDEWFGEAPETMHPTNREQFDDALNKVTADRDDPDAWDGTDVVEFIFEIGGIKVTRCFQSLAQGNERPAASEAPAIPSEPVLIEGAEDLALALEHVAVSVEMDLRHQSAALRDFALPALRYAALKIASLTSNLSPGMASVMRERRRQIDEEGYTPAHDDRLADRSIARAAAALATAHDFDMGRRFWPWDLRSWAPRDARRNLVRAGALIVAEIERLDRLKAKGSAA